MLYVRYVRVICVAYACCICVLRMCVAFVSLLCCNENFFSKYVVWTSIMFYQKKQNVKRTCILYVRCVRVICVAYACCICVLRMCVAFVSLLYYDENMFLKYVVWTSIMFYQIKKNAERTYVLYVHCACYMRCICMSHLRVAYMCCIYALLCCDENMFSKYVDWININYILSNKTASRTYVYVIRVLCVCYVCCVCALHMCVAVL